MKFGFPTPYSENRNNRGRVIIFDRGGFLVVVLVVLVVVFVVLGEVLVIIEVVASHYCH